MQHFAARRSVEETACETDLAPKKNRPVTRGGELLGGTRRSGGQGGNPARVGGTRATGAVLN